MNKVTVQSKALLNKISRNRDRHQEDFDEAMTGYMKDFRKALELKLTQIGQAEESGDNIPSQGFPDLPVPREHLTEYDRVIQMIEMSVEHQIELSSVEFAQYVQDDWAWKPAFVATSSNYKKSSTDILF